MDLKVHRFAVFWGTLVVGLTLVFVGVMGYIIVSGEIEWYRTPVSDPSEVVARDLGDYVRVEGRIGLNASEDIVIVEHEVKKAIWTTEEYEPTVAFFWLEADSGNTVLVLLDHVSETKPGSHGGDYHRGDNVCVGGTIADEGVGHKVLRANFIAKHPIDTPARFVNYYVAAAFGGMFVVLTLIIQRLFLNPRQKEVRDWRAA